MSDDSLKKAAQAGWNEMSDQYQRQSRISLNDVHYAPLGPGERDLRLIGDVSGKRVLELACGAAQNSIALSKWGARVTAIDFSENQLAHARELVRQEEVGVGLVKGDAEGLAMFKDDIFDLVVTSFGVEFIPDLGRCLKNCNRVLKSEGTLVLCTTHPLAAFEWDNDDNALVVTDYFNPPVEVWDELSGTGRKGITFFRTLEAMTGLLADAGFMVERIAEPYPYDLEEMTEEEKVEKIAYGGPYWEGMYERFSRVPFSIVYKAVKK